MDLDQIKSSWNEVLDSLLDQDRVAWIAFFDARLVSFENNELTLDFLIARSLQTLMILKKLVIQTTLSH